MVTLDQALAANRTALAAMLVTADACRTKLDGSTGPREVVAGPVPTL
jgi:hypothetical protein